MPILSITKRYDDGEEPTKSWFDAFYDSIETWANTTKLDSDNFQTSAVVEANIATDGVTTAALLDANVTPAKQAAANIVKSSPVTASDSTSTTTPTAVTGLSCTITTSGRPVMVRLQSKDDIGSSDYSCVSTIALTNDPTLNFYRDSTNISAQVLAPYVSNEEFILPSSSFFTIDAPAAGTYVYTVRLATASAPAVGIITLNNCVLCVYEI